MTAAHAPADAPEGPPPASGARPSGRRSLLRAGGTMAAATVASRVTGLAAKVLLAAVLGLSAVNDAYTLAGTLPTVVNELLLGGVLTSIAVPLLVRAERQGPGHGEAYAQWLLTMGLAVLLAATAAAVACAPLLTRLYLGEGTRADADLTTLFAYLLLPAIVFLGLSALLGAILNVRGRFGAPAWAPVCNNLVVIATLGVYALLPGEVSADPGRMGLPKLLVLAAGTVAGVAVQTWVLLAALRRSGFRLRRRFGWDHRCTEFGALAGWVVLYALVSQAGMVVVTRVAGQGAPGSLATFTYAWLLLQVPYGVLGVSLLTALMPRLSRAAAARDTAGLVADLSLGTRLTTVLLGPVSVLMTITGPAIGVALFSLGSTGVDAAGRLGATLGLSAFGLVPFALTMLQLRVFYALGDARAPVVVNLLMVAVRVVLCAAAPAVADPEELVVAVAAAMSLSFVAGAVCGQVWLRARIGALDTRRALRTLLATTAAAALGGLAAATLTGSVGGIPGSVGAAWLHLAVTTLVFVPVAAAGLVLPGLVRPTLALDELRPLTEALHAHARRLLPARRRAAAGDVHVS